MPRHGGEHTADRVYLGPAGADADELVCCTVRRHPAAVAVDFTAGTGSSGVEAFINATSNSIGYLSPDYTDIAPRNSTGGFPAVAAVTNASNGVTYLPTVANTAIALGTLTPPIGTNVSNPIAWAPLIPTPAAGYPVVGYTQMFFATCYNGTANAGVSTDLINFLTDHFNISGAAVSMVTDITNNGFVPVAGETSSNPAVGFALAVAENFLTNSSGNNLNIADTGSSSADPSCTPSNVVDASVKSRRDGGLPSSGRGFQGVVQIMGHPFVVPRD